MEQHIKDFKAWQKYQRYATKNAEQIAIRAKDWRAKHKAELAERNRLYRLKNAAELKEKRRRRNDTKSINSPRQDNWAKHKTWRMYGLSDAAFLAMNRAQYGGCAICHSPPSGGKARLSVDHCHKTGRVRKLLCNHCNTGLGMFYDDPDILRAAAQYLLDNT